MEPSQPTFAELGEADNVEVNQIDELQEYMS